MTQFHSESMCYGWWITSLDKMKLIVGVSNIIAFALMRSTTVVCCGLGAILCYAGANLMKLALRQPRPQLEPAKKSKTYGMPSTHAAAMAYYVAFILLSCRYVPLHPSIMMPGGDNLRIFFPMVTLPWMVSIVISRVLFGYHTWSQVVVGALYGCLFALGWFNAWVM